jgi:two-component system sensor histidine kinase UhpB
MSEPLQESLTRLLVSTINAREVENNRVSRVLHDDVGQVLTAVGFQLDVLRLDLQERVPEIEARTREIQAVLDQAVEQVRALSYDLNPAVVERAGLHAALDRLLGRFRKEFAGTIRFLFDTSIRIPIQVANAWYKITELAVDNAVRHACATRIEVHVRPTGKTTVLEVKDSGEGFSVIEVRSRPAGLGLLLMEHYASQAPIRLDIKSTPGKGTTVRSSYTPDSGTPRPD